VQQPQGAAHHAVAHGAVPGGWLDLGQGEPVAERREQQKVEEPVEHRLLPGIVAFDLADRQLQNRTDLAGVGHQEHPRECLDQAFRDVAADLVAAGEQRRRAGQAPPAGAHAEPQLVAELRPVGRRAAVRRVPGVPRRCGAVGAVGDDEGVGPDHDPDLVLRDRDGLALLRDDPSRSAQHGDQRQRGALGEADRPGRGQDAAAEERAVRAHLGQQVRQRVHEPTIASGWTPRHRIERPIHSPAHPRAIG
jgi:hypothetical protein